MNNFDEILNLCFSNMKVSDDFNDEATINSINSLLNCIIDNPIQIVNYHNEEKLSIALSSIMTSQYPTDYPYSQGLSTRNVVFTCAYYLFMHQLETGQFYDRDWPAFILLIHLGRDIFAKLIVKMNPFAPENINKLTGKPINQQRSLNAAKGFELNLMLTANQKGQLTEDLSDWYSELIPNAALLLEKDPFKKEAIPLYNIIKNYLKENDVTFVKG